jgi:hypothetical protein
MFAGCRRVNLQMVAVVKRGLAYEPESPQSHGLLAINPVGVEKGTKAVISVNFSVYGERIFNNLRTNLVVQIS